jgi:small subunit ribosomal protein S21
MRTAAERNSERSRDYEIDRRPASEPEGVKQLQVLVRDNNIDQALRVLKKKMQREGVFREMKRRRFYEKPSEEANRKKGEAIRRARKLARKQAIRDGSIAAPLKKRFDPTKRAGAPMPQPRRIIF